jgi:hypothetical protein
LSGYVFSVLGAAFVLLLLLANQYRRIVAIERVLFKQGVAIMSAIDDLAAVVARNTDVEKSAVQLLQGLVNQLEAARTDPAKVTALTEQLRTSVDALAAAVVANTPAAPPPTTTVA